MIAGALVIAVMALALRGIGDRLANDATGGPWLTQGAARYAVMVVFRLAEAAAVVLALWLLFRLTGQGSLAGLGLARSGVRWLPLGLVLPALALVLSLAIAAAAGWLRPTRLQYPGPWPALLALAAATQAAWVEELLFRGVLLQGIERLWGRAAGILATAALFVLLHLAAPFRLSPAWWALVSIGGLGLAWLFFAAGRNLWLTIGLHWGLDLAIFLAFGLPGETRGAVLWPAAGRTPALTAEAGWVLLLAAGLLAAVLAGGFRLARRKA